MNVSEEHFKASLCVLQALSLFCLELRDIVQSSYLRSQLKGQKVS